MLQRCVKSDFKNFILLISKKDDLYIVRADIEHYFITYYYFGKGIDT